jgi:predicted DNA-binding ribbon-helix-helix protein
MPSSPAVVMSEERTTIELAEPDAAFLAAYAERRGVSVRTLLHDLVEQLRRREALASAIHPDVRAISGLVPADVDARAAHHEHRRRKHSP